MSTYCVYSSSPDSCDKRFCGTEEECEQWIKDNEYRFPSFVRLIVQPAEESARWNRDFDIHSGSIYEQMNEIDDEESLVDETAELNESKTGYSYKDYIICYGYKGTDRWYVKDGDDNFVGNKSGYSSEKEAEEYVDSLY